MYLNPTFNEVSALKSANPDTLRITLDSRDFSFAVANGYGATHSRIHLKFGIYGFDLILNCRSLELIFLGSEDEVVGYGEFGQRLKQFLEDFIAL